MTAYTMFDTAIGSCGLAWGNAGITALQLPEATPDLTRRRLMRYLADPQETVVPQHIQQVIDAVTALTHGEPSDLTGVTLDLDAVSPYHRRLYEAIRAIRPGQTRTYGEIAADLGGPGAARAVGRAMGQNPCPIIVPCHRVVAANGKTGGFSAYGGIDTKLRLLAIEQAHRSTEGALF